MNRWIGVVAMLAVLGCDQAKVQGAVFTGIGSLTAFAEIYTSGVSADGAVVVGYGISGSGFEAFRWTRGGGMVALGHLTENWESYANGVSADGAVVVGYARNGTRMEAFQWTSDGGMVGLGHLAGDRSYAGGVSADGSVIVGFDMGVSGAEAFLWTSDGGMVGLGCPMGDFSGTFAFGVSGDGAVVVGSGDFVEGGRQAFRWTRDGGMVGLGHLAEACHSVAYGVSADGAVVVGRDDSMYGAAEAFRWTSSGGMVGLGHLAGDVYGGEACGVSADGAVIVGYDILASGMKAVIWDATHGMRSLYDVLAASGVDMTGWTLINATGVSADGRTIAGYGVNPLGGMEAWIATLDGPTAPVPEPATLAIWSMFGVSGIGMSWWRKRKLGRVLSTRNI